MPQKADRFARDPKNRKLSTREYAEGWKRAADDDAKRQPKRRGRRR